MKKYAVLKGYKVAFKPDVVEEFDHLEDAQQFCDLMNKIHEGGNYAVFEHHEYKLDGAYARNPDLIEFK